MYVFTILERLAPHVEKELNLILKSKHEAQTLKSKLKRIHDGLQDAERIGVTNDNVKRWLGELEDVMNEMDDALDQWETKNIKMQMEQLELDKLSDPWRKVPSLLLSVCSSFKNVIGKRKLVQEFIALSGKLDKILEEKGRYNFVSSDRSILQLENEETTSSVDMSKTHGRETDTDSLVDLLLSKKDEQTGTLVVSIVGIGGLGKTTLAQLVYNDARVEGHFGRFKAWVSVPNPFDAQRVATAILATFDRSSSSESTLETLGQRIKTITSGQNFLLVLDNVRSVDRAKWESLKNFLVGETGLRILVTTRDSISARTIGTTHFPRLAFLSDSDCAAILIKIALKETTGENHKEFLEIGFEIAKKCNGLPLAAKTIGHALETRFTTKEWRDLLESPLWMYEDDMSDILRLLRLSYMDLSPLLKRCFLSSVLYPKGFKFDSEGLIRKWMAQGYIDSSGDWDQVLAKGEKYLKRLSERSFFEVSGSNDEGNLTYKMHDILFDFANNLSRSEYYVTVDGTIDRRPYHMPTGRRIRYFCARFVSQKHLPSNLFRLLESARVLCLSDCDFEEFSEDLGKLVHLRYLDLSGNLMKELPATVSDLYNLQTLDLRRCRHLTRLPRGLEKLIKLRHLLISDTESLLEFGEELSKLTGLWTLDKCAPIRDPLMQSNQLRESQPNEGSITCQSLLACLPAFDREEDRADMTCNEEPVVAETETCADPIHSNTFDSLNVLALEESLDYEIAEDNVESVEARPRQSYLNGKLNLQLPAYLRNMRIHFSEHAYPPQLHRLSMLVTIYLEKMDIRVLTLEFFGFKKGTNTAVVKFPKLQTLTFSDCELWEEWEDLEEAGGVILPRLNYLGITLCPNLKALPHNLLSAATSLQELFVAGCPHLAAAYDEKKGADRDKISQIPKTIILASY